MRGLMPNCPLILVFSPTRVSMVVTTTVTRPIRQRAIMTSRTMPQILSRLPKIISRHAQVTHSLLKSTNQVILPWATIPSTANHPRQITKNHIQRLLTLFTPSLHLNSFSSNRSNSSRPLLSPLTNPSTSVLPTSASHLYIR